MDWNWIVLIGLTVGFVASLLTTPSGARGLVLDASLGIGGSLAASWFGRFAGLYGDGRSAGFIAAVIGASVVLLGHRLVARP